MKRMVVIAAVFVLAMVQGAVAFPGDDNTAVLDFIRDAREAGAIITLYKTTEDCATAFFGEQGVRIGQCSGRFQECLCIEPEFEIKFTETGILVSVPGDRGMKKKGIGTFFLPNESLYIARALYLYPQNGVGEPKLTELFIWLK